MPIMTEVQRRDMFSWARYHSAFIAPYNSADYRAVLDGLRRVKPPPARLLDFGTGHGSFLIAAREAGYDAQGVEFEDEAILKAEQHSGCPVSTLEAVERAGHVKFDVVQLSNVLVALPAPRETVGRLLRLLKPAGCFSIDQALESNPRFELLAMASFKRTRRAIGLDRSPDSAPTLLWRTNANAQRRFFGHFGCSEVFFHVSDDGWPYHTAGVTPSSLGGRVKSAIGRASIAISASPVGRILALGNRCRGVFAVPECND